MADTALTRDQIAGEALNILSTLRENARANRSNKLADVKAAFENQVSLEFDTYFFFLRKFHFIGMDREACLQLTSDGERILEGERRDRFNEAVQEYFASRIAGQSEFQEEEAYTSPGAVPPLLSSNEIAPEPRMERGPQAPPPPASRPPPAAAPPPPSERMRFRSRNEVEPTPPPAPRAAPQRDESRSQNPVEGKGQEIDLRYVKYDAIGQGPLGTVYRGRHTALGLDVAIKELKDIFGYFSFLQRGDVIKRLKHEICSQALVRHPSVAMILDQNCDVARPYFVMELCSGNLRQKLDAAGDNRLPPEEAIRLFLQIAYGLRAAHERGLVHGNLKPENVLLDQYGNAKIADFGISRVIEVDATKGMPQVFVGTGGMGYMSPEQLARASREPEPVSDVYGLGIMLYEMLTGQLPGRRSPLPSGVNSAAPAKLDPLFDRMTQDRREDRYPDIDAVLEDFYAAFDDGGWLRRGDLILTSCTPASAQADEPQA